MLSHLLIKNFAVIDFLEIPFETGLTVLTGETGAGKSIIINALNLILAGRANTDVVRTGFDSAEVEGIFELDTKEIDDFLETKGVTKGDGQLLVKRIVSKTGRNKIFINGCATTLAILSAVTSGLVDISGQHEHVSLMHADRHLDILDAYAGLDKTRAKMAKAFVKVSDLKKEIHVLSENIRTRFTRIDYIKFQLEEIDNAQLLSGERKTLEDKLEKLKNASKIDALVSKISDLLYENETSAYASISKAAKSLNQLESWTPSAANIRKSVDEIQVNIDEIVRNLNQINDGIDANPDILDGAIERLELIKHLERKHGGDIDHILAYAETMRTELLHLENTESRSNELELLLKKATEEAVIVADLLNKKRVAESKKLRKAVEKELTELNMDGTQFVLDLEKIDLGVRGYDKLVFLVSTNVGEEAKSIAKIASGGELSRIMLALKTVHSARDTVSTYIFDEVDTGIGGSTADKVGDKLATTADGHQVLCITHLAQIASRATHQFVVEKIEAKGRTASTIRKLTEVERVDEIARMLSGSRVTEKTREAAQEMLTQH